MYHFVFVVLFFVAAALGVAASFLVKPYGSHTIFLALGTCVCLGGGIVYFHGAWRRVRYAVGQHDLGCKDLDVSPLPWAPGPTLHEAIQDQKNSVDRLARSLAAAQSDLRHEVSARSEITERAHRHRIEVEGLMEFLRELRDADDVKEIHLSDALKKRLLGIVGRPLPDRPAPSEMPGGGGGL